MLLFPAIDLLGGQVVRLYQGDYAQSEVYSGDPARCAADFERAGAACLHVVDLDGAKTGKPVNFDHVQNIARATGLFIELGGGIRDEAAVEQCFAAGVSRVILGTAALRDTAFTTRMAQKYGDKIAVGVDARDGKVAVAGWLETTSADSVDFCRRMAEIGIQHVIYTDISRDGAMQGANIDVYRKLAAIPGLHITASGGVSSLDEIAKLRDLGCCAAILGKALYTGALKLEEALQTAHEGGT